MTGLVCRILRSGLLRSYCAIWGNVAGFLHANYSLPEQGAEAPCPRNWLTQEHYFCDCRRLLGIYADEVDSGGYVVSPELDVVRS
jgi:hypothetical protein